METLQDTRQLVVWTEPGALEQAKSEFSGFPAAFCTITARLRPDLLNKNVLLFYFHRDASQEQWERIFELCQKTEPEATLFYWPHHSSHSAFHLGWIAGKYQLRNAEWASSFHHLKQLLRERSISQTAANPETPFDILGARKRLGLTQDEMAAALSIAPRTLQNWERGVGLSQMGKKVRDLSELLSMMDEFVIAPKEAEWLKTPLEAFRNRTPIDLIKEGKLRDLIVEFHRLREGQPL
ncbi:MAG TPA: helix-turn-helix domain-containing protein [Candidatus Binatia bacterium]|nr:helix-turn-helix domain-containing protein [Candidatus Binatia bacterium]